MTERSKGEELLYRLLTKHFDGDLAWNYIEDTSVQDVDDELGKDLISWLADTNNLIG